MRETIDDYARKLEGLSTVELSRSAEKLVAVERRNAAALIAHLAEISRRKGHLELGYRSLFQYCQERLGLGESTVWKRTQVAGVARRFPQVLEHLAEGKVNLSVLAILAPHLTEENVDGVLKEAEGKTTRQAREMVAALDPKPAAEPMIRRKPVRSREESRDNAEDRAEDRAEEEVPQEAAPSEGCRSSRSPEPRVASRGTDGTLEGRLEVARPELYNFRFSAGRELKSKLERLAEVLGIANAERNMPEILDVALELALEKKDPKRKLERRRKREAAARGKTPPEEVTPEMDAAPRRRTPPEEVRTGVETVARPKTHPQDLSPEVATTKKRGVETNRNGRVDSRYVPSSLRERAFERASYQCEYTGPEGVRCTARTGLEIDHVEPWAKGGPSDEANLRVLCRAHNLYSAGREFGEEFMRERIHGQAS